MLKQVSSLLFFCSVISVLFGQNLQPKNIIIMIGDGMGFEQMQTSLYFHGKTDQNVWSGFPVKVAAATYNSGISYNPRITWGDKDYVLSGFTESAAAGTAIATGHRTLKNQIGISENGIPLSNLVQLATFRQKSTGIVTSVQFNHATPAAFVAHNQSRLNYGEIARNMILFSEATVIMGCGHPEYDNNGNRVDSLNIKFIHSEDMWNALTQQKTEYILDGIRFNVQDIDGDNIPDPWVFLDQRSDLQKIIQKQIQPKRLFFMAPVYETLSQLRTGISNTPFDISVNPDIPTLSEMALASLTVVSADPDGFFLMIEGGAIDWACHDNQLARLIEEQTEFEKTIEEVVQWLDLNKLWNETLLIVLADHECGYLAGGFDEHNNFIHVIDHGTGNLPGAEFFSTDHTNHLVPFFAKGYGSHIFQLLANDFDSVRGKYLHISDVAKTVKYFWGEEAFTSPSLILACPGDKITLTATAPFDVCSYRWNVNGEFLNEFNSPFFEIVISDYSQIFCELSCHTLKLNTNVVNVGVNDCE